MSQTTDTDFVDYANLSQQLDPTLVEEAMALIAPAQRIALLAHEHPDGDCLGSALGLAHMLRELGKTCVPACADAAPPDFSFLPGIETLQQTLGDEQFDLVIALDAGELSRYGSLYERHRAFLDRMPIVNLDHHISSPGCGQVNIISTVSAATGELLVLFQQQARLPLNKDAALCLLTGIMTDTGSFQYTNTTPRTLQAAAVLLQAGAEPESIAKPLFRTHPLAQLRLQAAVIDHVQTACEGRLIWSYATSEMLRVAGATEEMDDNFSGILRDIEGVEIAAFFKHYGDPTLTRMSLRCNAPYNAAEICKSLGGGGHARAAGATIHKPLAEAMELAIMRLKQEFQTR